MKSQSSSIYSINKKNLLYAKKLIKQWNLVAFPTETVYGLWADARNPEAIKKIFITKNRPQDNPLIVHVGKKSDIKKYANIVDPLQKKIIEKYMPGPITLLLPKKKNIPDITTAGKSLVGIRIPSNTSAQQFLKTCNIPIAAPSANISTMPSPTSAQMVDDMIGKKIPMILDGGNCEIGIESTVVMVPKKNEILIVRPGMITKEDLLRGFPKSKVTYAKKPSENSPGNKYKHYAPKAKVYTIKTVKTMIWIIKKHKKIWLIATHEFLTKNKKTLTQFKDKLTIHERWTKKNLVTCAKNLFNLYHKCDKEKLPILLIESLTNHWLGYAIMNRINKSTSK